MKWWLMILDIIFFWGIAGVGFKFFWDYGLLDWQFWIIATPLVVIGHLGTQWVVRKDEEKKRNRLERLLVSLEDV